jgi:alkylation response protein AidB-like acyl-CoA dehydrogenase
VPHSRLREAEDGFVLNASKSIVSGASHARWLILVCRLESDATGQKRAVLAPGAGQPGVFPFGEWNPIGMRATASTGLEYRDCFIPSWHAFEPGMPLARTMVPVALLGFCSVWLGIATAAFELAVAHVTGRSIEVLQADRRESGEVEPVRVRSSIARFESVQRQVSEMRTRIDAATAMVDNLARRIQEGQPTPEEPLTAEAFDPIVDVCSSCRIYTSETAIDVSRVAMRICGARGLQRGVALERFMRDALTAQVMGPTEDATKVWHGRRLLGVPPV